MAKKPQIIKDYEGGDELYTRRALFAQAGARVVQWSTIGSVGGGVASVFFGENDEPENEIKETQNMITGGVLGGIGGTFFAAMVSAYEIQGKSEKYNQLEIETKLEELRNLQLQNQKLERELALAEARENNKLDIQP